MKRKQIGGPSGKGTLWDLHIWEQTLSSPDTRDMGHQGSHPRTPGPDL